MPSLSPDIPYGRPSFALSDDQIATALDIVCCGAYAARPHVTLGMLEVPMTNIVRKAMKQKKRALGLTNLEIRGEYEIDDMATTDPMILGRIDIILQFLHQFGDEEAYLAVECKRVRPGDPALNGRYVSEGVDRFVSGQYAAGHEWGFMLGYMLALPAEVVIEFINSRIRRVYGERAKLQNEPSHPRSIAILASTVIQGGHHHIRLKHVFVDMLPAAP